MLSSQREHLDIRSDMGGSLNSVGIAGVRTRVALEGNFLHIRSMSSTKVRSDIEINLMFAYLVDSVLAYGVITFALVFSLGKYACWRISPFNASYACSLIVLPVVFLTI